MKQPSISALILAKNEAKMLLGCLKTVGWCQEIVVLDDDSTDQTVEIAENFGARVIHFTHPSFARKRMEIARHAKCDWLLYIDPDERITPELAQEIQTHLSESRSLQMHRKNVFYGHAMTAGGWQNDQVTRVFPKKLLTGWRGDIHESPEFTGPVTVLSHPLIHFSHRTIQEGLLKSASWTQLEAQAIAAANGKPVTGMTILRKGGSELYRRLIKARGYRDGAVGYVESVIQSVNKILVYLQVWELQQKPSIPSRYQIQEREIELQWEAARKEKKEL